MAAKIGLRCFRVAKIELNSKTIHKINEGGGIINYS